LVEPDAAGGIHSEVRLGSGIFQHLLLTRFNCRFGASWTQLALDPGWLKPRFEIFEKYCLPSILHQDCRTFKWVIFFDQDTPEPFLASAASLQSDWIKPIFVGTLTGRLIRDVLRSQVPTGATHVITTRLDNDDGLATDFISRLQNAFRPVPAKQYLNMTEGYILSSNKLFVKKDYHNAFVSLVEPVEGDIEGVWAYPHTEIAQHAPVRQIGGGPGWLQVVHGANVSNRVRGRRVPPSEIGNHFRLDRSELKLAGGLEYLWERHAMSRWWAARDAAAEAYRLGKRLVGKGWKPEAP
jgi:N-acetylglucosaminyl-diphospho-decaprenol L-rhamnosyltransferase